MDDLESNDTESLGESAAEELFHDSIEAKNKEIHTYSDDDSAEKFKPDRSRSNLVLDLRNVPPIVDIIPEDNENSDEKLSAHFNQSENSVSVKEVETDETGTLAEPDAILRERMNVLQKVIIDLKEELKVALSLWRKERDEFQIWREKIDIQAVEEATAAARAAAEAYAAESPLSSEIAGNMVEMNPVQSLSELTILEYEKKLARYQDALALAQAERRYNMRRKLIANTFRQRLVEVERMCDEELEKIRQSANILQPLRRLASQWVNQTTETDGGTIALEFSDKTEKKPPVFGDRVSDNKDKCKISAVDAEVNMLPEMVAARFSNMESSKYEISNAMRNPKKIQSHLLVQSNSVPFNYRYAPFSNS